MIEEIIEAARACGWKVGQECECPDPRPVIVGGSKGEIGFVLPGSWCRSCRREIGDPSDGPLAGPPPVSQAYNVVPVNPWAELGESLEGDCPTAAV